MADNRRLAALMPIFSAPRIIRDGPSERRTGEDSMTERNAPGCEINITINSSGDVNIYNCTGGETKPEPCAPATPPGGPGACLPLALGSSPNRASSRRSTG